MNNTQRLHAIMNYEKYDRMPLVVFGFWRETLLKWAEEGHITIEDANNWGDGNATDHKINQLLGFDFNWGGGLGFSGFLNPSFKSEVLEVLPDGSEIRRDSMGLITKSKPGVVSIPAHVGTTLKDRKAWEEEYLPRLRFFPERVDGENIKREYERLKGEDHPIYLHLGSLYGNVRNMVGVEELSYLAVDDEELYEEIVDTVDSLCYECVKEAMKLGLKFDYGHFWEDICFKTGPLLRPAVFGRLTGKWYKKITDEMRAHGTDIISLDCDGKIDELVPIWLENGVNTMFPIEVGTWNASIAPWREKYGPAIKGVGGMDKRVFSKDFKAVDAEIERLKPLIDLGGYIPCPDHRIAPDAKWDNVRYYCDRFRQEFGG